MTDTTNLPELNVRLSKKEAKLEGSWSDLFARIKEEISDVQEGVLVLDTIISANAAGFYVPLHFYVDGDRRDPVLARPVSVIHQYLETLGYAISYGGGLWEDSLIKFYIKRTEPTPAAAGSSGALD